VSAEGRAVELIDAVDSIPMPEAGTKQRGVLRFAHPAIADLAWPYTVIRGHVDGPRVALISGVHPTEYPPIEANIRLAREIGPESLRGTIVSVPVVNPPAFLSRNPFVNPIDGKNPNRFFPGHPEGTSTEVITHAIFTSVIEGADCLLDLHGGDMVEDLIPFSIYSVTGNERVDAASAAIGRAFGLPYLIAHRPQPGGLGGTSVQAAGVPGIVAEAGGRGLLTEADTQLLVDGAYRVLAHLGMIDRPAEPQGDVIDITAFTWLTAPAEGMWYPSVVVGERVAKEQPIGELRDLFGDRLATITSPHDGYVLFITSSPAMRENGLLLAVGAP
jgi:uncharacterized protein